mgnify:CR=1 FL=1
MAGLAQATAPVLVTGGAGYIGSHAVLALQDAGVPVVVVDDLSNGSRAAVPGGVPLEVADIADSEALATILARHCVTDVMHFAGSVRVDESVSDPLKYYRNNTAASLAFVRTCLAAGVRRFIFSSTAAVYGAPETATVTEESPLQPINPYGWSKRMTEQMLVDLAAAGAALLVAMLRYFNVAGADPAGRAGQRNRNATHLIHVASQVANGQRPHLDMFGTDYDTPDGTCVRDYIHVMDLAEAHVAMLDHLYRTDRSPLIFNCGYGRGYSVREVVAAIRSVTGADLPVKEVGRRAGDPPSLISDCRALGREIDWQPRYDKLETIIETAVAWQQKLAQSVS